MQGQFLRTQKTLKVNIHKCTNTCTNCQLPPIREKESKRIHAEEEKAERMRAKEQRKAPVTATFLWPHSAARGPTTGPITFHTRLKLLKIQATVVEDEPKDSSRREYTRLKHGPMEEIRTCKGPGDDDDC